MSFEEFLGHLSEVLDMPAADLKPDSKLADLEGWNSMALVSFIAFVDEYLERTLSPRVIGPCRTIADLAMVSGVNP
jgi:acyl carrier protein